MTTSEEAYEYLLKKFGEKPKPALKLITYNNAWGDCFSKPFDNSDTSNFQGQAFLKWSCSKDCRLVISNKTGKCVFMMHSTRCSDEYENFGGY